VTSDDLSINYKFGRQYLNNNFAFLQFKKINPRRRIKGLKNVILNSISSVNRARLKADGRNNRIQKCEAKLSWTELGWLELGWAGLSWAELNWTEFGWAELGWAELSWIELSLAELSWAGLITAELRWARLGWAELGWEKRPRLGQTGPKGQESAAFKKATVLASLALK